MKRLALAAIGLSLSTYEGTEWVPQAAEPSIVLAQEGAREWK